MTQYIDKAALVAEIERLKKIQLSIFSKGETQEDCYDSLTCISVYNEILSFLDTIEVKEVELTWKDIKEICTQSVLVEIDLGGLVSDERHYTEVLKRFKEKNHE